MRKSLFGVTVATLTLITSQPLLAQNDADHQLGNVHFKTSCNDVAQRRFDRGMRYQHSYWYINAKEVFEEAIKADPTCAIAYWGIALTLMDNPHNAIPRPNLAPGPSIRSGARGGLLPDQPSVATRTPGPSSVAGETPASPVRPRTVRPVPRQGNPTAVAPVDTVPITDFGGRL